MSNTVVVELVEDVDTGEIMVPIPYDILSQMGWIEGTELWWEQKDDKFILRSKNETDKPE
jgi:hypothetical protein